MSKTLKHAIEIIDAALKKLIEKFQRHFRFSTLTPAHKESQVFGQDASELCRALSNCIDRIKLSHPHFKIGLAETGVARKQRAHMSKELDALIKNLGDLKNYFNYVQKHEGRLPRRSPAGGLCTILTLGAYKPNKLVKFNDEPMIKYAESLEDSFKKLVKKELETIF